MSPRRDHRAARALFLLVGGPVTALLIAVTAFGFVGTLARETTSHPIEVAGPVDRIRVAVTQGSVTLRGADQDRVTGERVTTRGLREPGVTERVDGTTLVIEAWCMPLGNTWCDVSYVLDVPRGIDVEVETALGSIRASGLDGALDLFSATGSVDVDAVTGSLRLESGAGSVQGTALASKAVVAESGAGSVRLAFAGPPDRVTASAGAGSIDIEVPDDGTAYRIDDVNPGTDVRVAVPTDPVSGHLLRLDGGAGSVSVHHPEA
jgi:hypothetical protein